MPVPSRSLVLFLCLLVLSVVACLPGGRGGGDDDDGGDYCFTDADCSEGEEYCKATDPSASPEGACQSLESAGDACTLGSHCVSGLFCLVDNSSGDGTCSSAPSACDDGPSCNCEPMLEMCASGGFSCDGSGDSVTLHCNNGLGGGGGDDDDTGGDDDDTGGDDDDATEGEADGTVPCSINGTGMATVDIWEVTGAGTLQVDTISDSTTFDPVAWFATDASGTLSKTSPTGDDDFACTFPPPTYSCPRLDAPGAGFLVVGGYTEDCNSSGTGSYSVSGPLGAQAADNVEVSTGG
jgi:hypothetical protein